MQSRHSIPTEEELNVLNGVEDLDPEGPVYQHDNVKSKQKTN